jgi:hypothetical protein
MEAKPKLTLLISKRSTSKQPKPPKHLSAKMREWWLSVVEDYELEPHHVLILTKAAEAHDRADQARAVLRKKGVTYRDRFRQPCARPEIAIERESRIAFARLVRELNLSEDSPNTPRPPGLKYGARR